MFVCVGDVDVHVCVGDVDVHVCEGGDVDAHVYVHAHVCVARCVVCVSV